MEILIFKFEGLISNNKENKNFASTPPRDAPGTKIFFLISLIYMEILVYKFEGPICNNEKKTMF